MQINNFLFDQYSRYKACFEIIEKLGLQKKTSILDVGSGPECLFGNFFIKGDLYFLDPLIPNSLRKNFISRDIFSKNLILTNYNYVTAIDVYEHIPKSKRIQFLRKLSNHAQDHIILGFPSSDLSDASKVDLSINNNFASIYNSNYSWLDEHFKYGLPSAKDTCDHLEDMGWHCQIIGHGHAPWLKETLSLVINSIESSIDLKVAYKVSEKFNSEFYKFDFNPPFYRNFIIASKKKLPKINLHADNIIVPEINDKYTKFIKDSYCLINADLSRNSLGLKLERDNLKIERDNLKIERDNLKIERDNLKIERDNLKTFVTALQSSKLWNILLILRKLVYFKINIISLIKQKVKLEPITLKNIKKDKPKWLGLKSRKSYHIQDPNKNLFTDHHSLFGFCNICGENGHFYYKDKMLFRESLTCMRCLSTSRYRSIARGILKFLKDFKKINISSLSELSNINISESISIYDTQSPFKYSNCAYPIPELLSKNNLIKVNVSTFNRKKALGEHLILNNQKIEFTNQNLEKLSFDNSSFDIVITSDVMEHVRLDKIAHIEIYRILKYGGVYLFTVPHNMKYQKNLERVKIITEGDISKDKFILEPEYHGDVNSEENCGALSYRVYGKKLIRELEDIGFSVEYTLLDFEENAILNTELFFCRK